jgi:signal transduction histidine kinase
MGRLNPLRWPLTVKAPAMVVVFMLAISVIITHAVLERLRDTQERHLNALSATYLDGLASAVLPYVLREDVWEVFDAIERNAAAAGGMGRAFVIVTDERRRVLAASDPARVPLGSDQASRERPFAAGRDLVVDERDAKAHARRMLRYQGRDIGRIFADYDIAHLMTERREVFRTLVLTNATLTLLLAILAYWTIRRMLFPLARLSRHIAHSTTGPLQPIAVEGVGHGDSEFARLYRRYNSLVEALAEREELARQLAAEERVASLGRLASGMAHEINNPLGGLFNAIDTLKSHGDKASVRRSSVDLIERGLRGIRDVVRTTLATYRADREQRDLTAADLDDMRLLVEPELRRKQIAVSWSNSIDGDVPLPASSIRQILLNLLLNAVAIVPERGRVSVAIDRSSAGILLAIEDSGPCLPPAAKDLLAGRITQPIQQGEGTGLGLWLSRRLTLDLGGDIAASPAAGGGTRIVVSIPLGGRTGLRDVA